MKCERGDRAKIIFSIRQENIGKTVLVDSYIGHFKQGEVFNFRGIDCTIPVTDHYWWISAELTCFYGDTPKAYIADSWLEPIRPDRIEQTEKEEFDINA